MDWPTFSIILGGLGIIAGALVKIFGPRIQDRKVQEFEERLDNQERRLIVLEQQNSNIKGLIEDLKGKVEKVLDYIIKIK